MADPSYAFSRAFRGAGHRFDFMHGACLLCGDRPQDHAFGEICRVAKMGLEMLAIPGPGAIGQSPYPNPLTENERRALEAQVYPDLWPPTPLGGGPISE